MLVYPSLLSTRWQSDHTEDRAVQYAALARGRRETVCCLVTSATRF